MRWRFQYWSKTATNWQLYGTSNDIHAEREREREREGERERSAVHDKRYKTPLLRRQRNDAVQNMLGKLLLRYETGVDATFSQPLLRSSTWRRELTPEDNGNNNCVLQTKVDVGFHRTAYRRVQTAPCSTHAMTEITSREAVGLKTTEHRRTNHRTPKSTY